MEDKRIKLHEEEIEYKKGLKWYKLPYSEIVQAYLRVEEVTGRLCCGVANFDMCFLVLKTSDGVLIKTEASSKDIVKEMLDVLKERNPDIEIGYKQQED